MPANIMSAVAESPGTIKERRQLSSVNRLSPNNPLYPAIDHIPIQVPYHSIMGDRGKGDTPNSSDGVVPYWSSHVDGARSELIVPGPHGSYSLPQTIAELKRILKLHLASGARAISENARTIPAAIRLAGLIGQLKLTAGKRMSMGLLSRISIRSHEDQFPTQPLRHLLN